MATIITISRAEAQDATDRIKRNVAQVASDLLFLWENSGWAVLGYNSWHEFLETEFKEFNHTYLRRVTHAARLESQMTDGVGNVPESHLRPLLELIDDDEERKQVFDKVVLATDSPIAQDFEREAVLFVLERDELEVLEVRVTNGDIGYKSARQIYALLSPDYLPDLIAVMSMCSDPKLAEMLPPIYENHKTLWEEIIYTGCIPAFPAQVPIQYATHSTLIAWLDIDSSERRARHSEDRREFYSRVNGALERLLNKAEAVCINPTPAVIDELKKAVEEVLLLKETQL